jgi:glycerol-3-phosphate dehydrogenase
VHGGLRYLEMLDFGLVREALEERGLLLTRLAPHLVRPVPFLYPLHRTLERPYVGAGLALYDALAMVGKYEMGLPKHKHLLRRQVARIAPDLRTDTLTGAVRYYDCQVDDARLVVTLARTAAHHGALVATRTRVTGFLREGPRVCGVRATDLENGRDLEVRARVVLTATGVWTDDVERLLGSRPTLDVEASKGIHLVVPRDRIRSECGFITKTEKSVLFVIPWGRHWIVGTTDTAWNLDLAHPAASRRDIDYLLEHVNKLLKVPLDHTDVEGVYAGLRPLLAGKAGRGVGSGGEGEVGTTKVSREHTVVSPVPGLVLVADGYIARTNQRVALSRRSGLEVGRIDHLLGRYGGLVDELLALVASRPELAAPLPGTEDYLSAEVVHAVTHEGARHLDDVLARRTRISIETFDRGTVAVTAAADLMAAELGWDRDRRDDEVDHYLRRVEAERQSQEKLTDQEADEARVSAPDIV